MLAAGRRHAVQPAVALAGGRQTSSGRKDLMDLNKLTTGDKVIAGSGIVFLIAMFLPW